MCSTFIVACETDVIRTAAFQIDTVAGIPYASNAAQEPAAVELVMRIGRGHALDAPSVYEFGSIGGVALDSVGRVYVADAHAKEIRVFDSHGTHVRTLGREGAGPGEFRQLYSIAWLSDTLVVLDPGNVRIALLDTLGRSAGQVSWLPMTGSFADVRLFTTGPREIYALGLNAGTFLKVRVPEILDTLVVQARRGMEQKTILCRRSDRGISFFGNPFAPRFISIPAPDGIAATASTAEYRIVIRRGADSVRVVSRDLFPVALPDSVWKRTTEAYRQFIEDNPGARCEPDRLERPSTLPALKALSFDYSGTLVVEVEDIGSSMYEWFDRDGRLLRSVRFPHRDDRVPPYFRFPWIAQVERDSLDVQRVAVYRVAER